MTQKLVVHYHRTDGVYDEAGLWAWNAGNPKRPHGREVFAKGRDDFGAVFEIDIPVFSQGAASPRIGLIPRIRRSWDRKDGGDRVWTPDLGGEAWIVQGDDRLHATPPDIRPRVLFALLDSPGHIRLVLSHTTGEDAMDPAGFALAGPNGALPRVARVQSLEGPADCGGCRLWRADLAEPLADPAPGMELRIDGYPPAPLLLGRILYTDERFRTDAPMGCLLEADRTVFRLFSPNASAVRLLLWNGRDDEAPAEEHDLARIDGGAWEIALPGRREGAFYGFRTGTPGWGSRGPFADPHAVNTVGRIDRSRITDIRALDPPGFRPIRRPALPANLCEAAIYELSIRDFTIDESSGVRLRGKYLGLAEFGARLPADHSVPTGIDHLKDLGVTHVQILPVQDFDNDEDDPAYNWGYMTAFFNSPEGWFATDHRTEARVAEFKELVQALHEAGIGVILDVVYNHTGTQASFESAAPGYYHRLRADQSFWNGSGTGNEFDSEAPMARRFIVDSCRFWVEEYGVDGFRFDLMGLVDIEAMEQVRDALRAIDDRLLLYGEPWTGGESGLGRITDKAAAAGTGIGCFNDDYRNALKGEPEGPWAGYVHNASRIDGVRNGIAGSIDDWAHAPADSVNYATCHDNLTLWDKTAECSPEPEEERVRMQMLCNALLAVSQGGMFLHSGAEFCRTKGGHPNSYDAGDEVNAIRWDLKRKHAGVFEHAAGMIALRREHPVFHLAAEEEVRRRLCFRDDLAPRPGCLVFTLDGEGLERESWASAVVCVNPCATDVEFALPLEGEADIHALGGQASPRAFGKARGALRVPRRSLAVAAVPKRK